MNKESKKLTWAVGLVAGLGVLSIAYAALSSTLNIKGEDASVNVGYVRFVGGADGDIEYVKDTSGCQPWGIGSTNKEYIKDMNASGTETASGNIFSRDDGETSLITTAAKFDKNWAQALAKPGTLTLSATNKIKDTATIANAELNDYGSFIVYKLDIINESSNDMRLKDLPDIKLNGLDPAEGGATDGNIERVIYTDCVKENFVTPCTDKLTKTEVDSDGAVTDGSKTAFNYLAKNGGKTTWYLRVGFKNYNETSNNIHGKTTFNFSVIPQWEAVM